MPESRVTHAMRAKDIEGIGFSHEENQVDDIIGLTNRDMVETR